MIYRSLNVPGLTNRRRKPVGGIFRRLNASVEPLIRSDFAAPGLLPAGLIVLETTAGEAASRTAHRFSRRWLQAATSGSALCWEGESALNQAREASYARALFRLEQWLCHRLLPYCAPELIEGALLENARRRWRALSIAHDESLSRQAVADAEEYD